MRIGARIFLAVLLPVLAGAPAVVPAAGEAAPGAEAAFLRRTALFRAEAGAGAVRSAEELNREARRYAREMAERGALSHRDEGGGRVLDRLTRAGYSAAAAGEVLGFGPGTWEIFDAWLESPAHRRVLAGGRWNRCGAGAWVTSEGVLTAAVILAEKREVPHGRK